MIFDSRSGQPLVTVKRNSDESGLMTYKIPLHWSNGTAKSNNQLSLISEERVYSVLASDDIFDRGQTYQIVKASANKWATVQYQKDIATRATSSFLYKVGSYDWSRPMGWGDFSPPDGNYSAPWRPSQDKVTLLNPFGYPIERVNEVTGLYSSEFTGYGTNLVTGTVAGAKWNTATIYTADYDVSGGSGINLDKINGWVKSSTAGVVVNAEAPHYGLLSTKLLAGASLSNSRLLIDPAKKKITMEASVKAISGAIRVEIQPVQGSTNAGASKYVDMTSTSWATAKFEIDLTQSQYSSANGLMVRVWAQGTASGYVDNIRVYPSDAMAKSYFYDPATLKLVATVDENLAPKSFAYDARGRLTTIKNSSGQVVSQAVYKDWQ
jgi:YD repeat-containing protein